MRHHTAVILISAVLATARGCIYPFEADLDQTEGRMVIEGDIRIGDLTTIQVSHLKSTLEEETKAYFPVYNPTSIVPFYATIEGEDGTRIEARGDNSCVLDTRNLTASQRYKLLIEDYTTGENYASDWIEVTGRPVLDDSHYSKNEENDEIRFLLSIHSDGSTPYYSIAYSYTSSYAME